MEVMMDSLGLIDLMTCPGFCVQSGKIIRVNEAAKRCFLEPGMDLLPLLAAGREEYASFQEGCLSLTITLAGQVQGASVTKIRDGDTLTDVFIAHEQNDLQQLQVLALAAQELRMPLSNVILSADQLSSRQESAEGKDSAARLNRGTAQLQRIICNMSDALRYSRGARFELKNMTALMAEVFEKAAVLAEEAGVSLSYKGPAEDIFSLADPEQLERAVYNLISNALKFSKYEKKKSIRAQLVRKGNLLQLTIQDNGSGIAEGILHNIFSRYRRQPSLEDSRFGLGLGMVIVRAAAANHGGTVLVEGNSSGTRICMTLAIQEKPGTGVSSPILTVDYAGERDHGLLELSDSLPAQLYLP